MGKLVTDNAYAHEGVAYAPYARSGVIFVQLVAACVGVDSYPIQHQVLIFDVKFVGPDGFRFRRCGLSIAGIDHDYLVYNTVIIPVVIPKVNFVVDRLTGFDNHFRNPHVFLTVFISAVIGEGMLELHRPHDIKSEVELSVALVIKIIMDAANASIVFVSRLVNDFVKHFLRVIVSERVVAEIHQDDESFFLSRILTFA